MIKFEIKHPRATEEHLGLIPTFLREGDPRSAAEQFEEHYAHGGGWRPMPGWELYESSLCYPGDERPYALLAETRLREETIRVYDGAWVAIIQPDGKFEVSRMD